MLKKDIKKYKSGFTIIEALALLFIFSVITLTFYGVITLGTGYIASSKDRLGAVAVANEMMETIRNLKYEDIGTVTGSVTGSLLDSYHVVENNSGFDVHITVQYIDDSFDNVFPTDIAPEDYKKVTVNVSWGNGNGSVKMISRFVPDGLEVANPGDGYLRINVFSDQPGGTGIPNSNVHIVNPETGLDTTVTTDSTGSVILMGDKVTDSIQKYRIMLAKSGYENVSTMPPYPSTAYEPIDVDASVVIGSMNVFNIVQNELASLKVKTVDHLDNVIPDISFHISGGRILGNTVPVAPDLPAPVYSLDEDASTNSSGEKDFGSVSPGKHTFNLDPSVTNYTLIDTDPISPVSLYSNDDMTLKVKLADNNVTSLLVKIVSSIDNTVPIGGATVNLTNISLGYDVTLTSSDTGTVFFPADASPLLPGMYNMKITAGGFADYNGSLVINADQLKTENVVLVSL